MIRRTFRQTPLFACSKRGADAGGLLPLTSKRFGFPFFRHAEGERKSLNCPTVSVCPLVCSCTHTPSSLPPGLLDRCVSQVTT